MALGFDNARTSLAATFSSAAIAAGTLMGCGGGQPGSQEILLPATTEQRTTCQGEYNRAREDAQNGIDAATPGAFTKTVDAIGGNKRTEVSVATAVQIAEGRYNQCVNDARLDNTLKAREARQQAQPAAASASQPPATTQRTEESAPAPSHSASTSWTEKAPAMGAIKQAMCNERLKQDGKLPETCRGR